jgi:hypothetical protein
MLESNPMTLQPIATPEIDYPDSDGNPMSDNTEQYRWIVIIKENLEIIFAEDPNVFINEVSSVPLQQGLRHLQTAFTNFFAGRAAYPIFKKRRNGGSAEFTKSAFKW